MADSRKDILDDNDHWDKLFKLCAYVIGAVIIYCFLITFVPIPHDNLETARQVLIFFIGTLVGYCFNLLSPGITSKRNVPAQLNIRGDNTNVTGTTTTTNESTEPAAADPAQLNIRGDNTNVTGTATTTNENTDPAATDPAQPDK